MERENRIEGILTHFERQYLSSEFGEVVVQRKSCGSMMCLTFIVMKKLSSLLRRKRMDMINN